VIYDLRVKLAVAVTAVFGAVLVLLWVLPIVLFQHPSPNEDIELSNLEMPVYFIGLVGLVIAMFAFRGRRATVIRVALGVLCLGVAGDLLLGLAAFGNLSDDRFMALLFLPVPIAFAGVVAIVLGLGASGWVAQDILRGIGIGAAGAVGVGAWTLLRGAREWLLAPYGFDITVLIVVVGVAIAAVGSVVTRMSVAANSRPLALS